MAPVEAQAHSNFVPYALFAGRISLVLGLTVNILLTTRRAAKSLPPATRTRSQQPLRRSYAILFSVLAGLSLASVTTFAVVWRLISYMEWAAEGRRSLPIALWRGWYGRDDARWHLRDWSLATSLERATESDLTCIQTPEGFLWTAQHHVALLASAIFIGIEGRRRNLPNSTIASFVLLGATGSLGYALSLFFVTMLYTPLTLHSDDTPLHDALFAPSPAVYYVPIALSILVLYNLPDLLLLKDGAGLIVKFLRYGQVAIPLFLAFAPQIVPVSLGRQYSSKTAAHRSYSIVFKLLATASTVMSWTLFSRTLSGNRINSYDRRNLYDVLTDTASRLVHGEPDRNNLRAGLLSTAERLRVVSTDPVMSITSFDVFFTLISLLAWTFTRDLDVEAILSNSVLWFTAPKPEKHVAFEEDLKRGVEFQPKPEPVDAITPKKRGRPAKNTTAINGASAIRRSMRAKTRGTEYDSDEDADAAYQPTEATRRQVAEIEADGVATADDMVHSGESTALAMVLAFIGGLGHLAAGTLGAEVTGA